MAAVGSDGVSLVFEHDPFPSGGFLDGVAVWAARHALFAICGLLQRLLRRSRENYFAVSCTRVSARSLRCRVARFSPSSEASGGIDILVLAKELALRHMQAAATPLIARGQK